MSWLLDTDRRTNNKPVTAGYCSTCSATSAQQLHTSPLTGKCTEVLGSVETCSSRAGVSLCLPQAIHALCLTKMLAAAVLRRKNSVQLSVISYCQHLHFSTFFSDRSLRHAACQSTAQNVTLFYFSALVEF